MSIDVKLELFTKIFLKILFYISSEIPPLWIHPPVKILEFEKIFMIKQIQTVFGRICANTQLQVWDLNSRELTFNIYNIERDG